MQDQRLWMLDTIASPGVQEWIFGSPVKYFLYFGVTTVCYLFLGVHRLLRQFRGTCALMLSSKASHMLITSATPIFLFNIQHVAAKVRNSGDEFPRDQAAKHFKPSG